MIENKDYFMGKWQEVLLGETALTRYKAKQFIRILTNAGAISEFDMDLYYKFVGKMIVYQGNKIIISLLDGTEIEVVIE